MDLQAILNASDSSDDDFSEGAPIISATKYSVVSCSSQQYNRTSIGSLHVDLEQVLNEDDSSDENDDILPRKFGKPRSSSSIEKDALNYSFPLHVESPTFSDGRYNHDYKSQSRISTTVPLQGRNPASTRERKVNTSIDSHSSYVSSSHNPEDWAILQAILHEEEDDDNDESSDEEFQSKWNNGSNIHPIESIQKSIDLHLQLDDKIQHSKDHVLDQEDDLDFIDSGIYDNNLPSNKQDFPHNSILEATIHGNALYSPQAQNSSKQISSVGNFDFSMPVSAKLDLSSKISDPSATTSFPSSSLFQLNVLDNDNGSYEDASRRAFEQALNSERKLLRSAHREIVSPLMVKRRLKPKIQLSSRANALKNRNLSNRNQRQKATMEKLRHSSVSMGSRFNFSGVVENKVMSGVSKQLVKHADVKLTKVLCGLPTCLVFNSKFIAVGTQLGIILIFDLFEVLRQRLGASNHDENWVGGKIVGSITSIDLSQNGEAVVAGYTSGVLVLWDTIRGVVLRSVTDIHISPITSVRFLNELKMVTVDAGGLVNKLTFTKNLLWSNYSMEPECLLDGTAGQILAMSILPQFSTVKPLMRPQAFAKVLSKLTLMALSSERSSFVVAVDPKVNVLHRWARPPADCTDPMVGSNVIEPTKTYLPCLAWGWGLISGGGNVVMPTLARAWGCCLQIMCASFPTVDDVDSKAAGMEPIVHWPAFGVHDEIDSAIPIIAIDWLNDRTLVYLTEANELTLVDTVMMTLLERLDFSGANLVYAEFCLSRGAKKDSASDDDTSVSTCMVLQNSTRCSDDRLMVLCKEELLCISIVGARRRISSLEADGEWLEALAFALDHYENTVLSQEDRKRDPNARKDLARHPEFSVARSDEEEWIAKLLLRYLSLAVENAPEALSANHRRPYSPERGQRIDLAQSHYQMLCGVACEFCLSIRRIDLLFGPIFRRFESVGYTDVFLDVLEPYILNDKLSYVAPEVMSLFVEHCKATNGIATVERCILHMDCTIMDFDSILSLFRRNEMFTAMFFVFNQGLDDYVTPLEILMEKLFDEADAGGRLSTRSNDGRMNEFERLGYKGLVYLQTCFKGKNFPRENTLEPEERQQSVNDELLDFLTQRSFTPSSHVKKAGSSLPVGGQRSSLYPYLRLLLNVDPWCTLETIAIALDTLNDSSQVRHRAESFEGWVDGSSIRRNSGEEAPNAQKVVEILSCVLLPKHTDVTTHGIIDIVSKGGISAFLEFASKYLVRCAVNVDKSTTFSILQRKANQFSSAKDAEGRSSAQQQIMALLSALPRDSYDPDKVLEIFNHSKMHRASLLLHQQVASSWHDSDFDDIELRTRHFVSAIDCYLGDEDLSFRKEVFHYVKKECSGISDKSDSSEAIRPKTLRDALLEKLGALVKLDSLLTARLVADLFADDLDRVIAALNTNDGGEGQFLFFQAIISGKHDHTDPVIGSFVNLDMDHHQMYLALMAKLHPEMVYDYLSTHDTYRNEESLRLCQQYDIADASAYLLERMGNVSSALQLILQTLESRLITLKRTIRGLGVETIKQHSSVRYGVFGANTRSSNLALPTKQVRDVEGVTRILIVALDVCERNSERTSSFGEGNSKFSHGELWFNVLDRLISAKGFLRLTKEQPEHAKVMAGVLSDLLRLTMQRMVSSVPLTDLVRKVTSDHSGSRIGELRELVESLLATYGFELKVFQGAVTAFQQDLCSMNQLQYSVKVRGCSVKTIMNIPIEQVHSEHGESILQQSLGREVTLGVERNSNCSFAEMDCMRCERKAETGLANALSRLRCRRQSVTAKGNNSHCSDALNMMTLSEQLFYSNDVDPVVYDRFSGVLGEAEHTGRLMMFQ